MKNEVHEGCKVELITVLTLNFNNPFLYESIDSVLAQTYSDIQYVIFDDCSQKVHFDVEEIKRYIETHNKGNIKKVVVKQNEKNMGIIKNLNRALKYVKGKYIFHLAGDDAFYDSKVLEEWTAYFKETKAEIVTAYRAVYDEKLEKEICVLPEKEDLEILKTGNQKKIWDHLCCRNFIFGCSTARTKQCMDESGGYDESYHYVEDYPWNLKMVRRGYQVQFWERIVIKYRWGGISSPARFNWNYLKDSLRILRKEILPYSNHKRKDINNFYQWLKRQLKEKYYYPYKNKIKGWMKR